MAFVRPSHDDDHYWIAGRLRAADKKELDALGRDAYESLYSGHILSRPCAYTVVHRARPIAMFGVVPMVGMPEIGVIWLLGTKAIEDIRWQFLRQSRRWLARLEHGYLGLTNNVHAENDLHIKWLKWLGFHFIRRDDQFLEFAKCVSPSR